MRLSIEHSLRKHAPLRAVTACPVIELPASLEAALLAGHPWVYRDHVPPGFSAASGSWVELRARRFVGYGLWDASGPLAVRIYSRTRIPDGEWFRGRLGCAVALREALVEQRTTAYRMLNGEGDGLPGIVVDRYGPFAVLVLDSDALETLLPAVLAALRDAGSFRGIVRRRRGEHALEVLWGRSPPARFVVEENGLRFAAELARGQKTGQFLDQRENRSFVESMAAGRSVLNLFGYTGGFSVYAARGGAVRTTTVDVSAEALAAAQENFRLNGMDPDQHEFIAADVFDYLSEQVQAPERFDLIVCDPPSLARRSEHVKNALRAYTRMNAAGLRRLSGSGLYAASSCSSRVTVDQFRVSLANSAQKARRRLQIVRDAAQPIDHPVAVGHPEGRYLKFLMTRALPD